MKILDIWVCFYFSTHFKSMFFSPNPIKLMILTTNLIILWKLSLLVFLPIFEKLIVHNFTLLKMLEKWKGALDYWNVFDTVNRWLLLAKLKAYARQQAALKLMQNYLKCLYQKANNVNSLWSKITAEAPQVSVLVPFAFQNFFKNVCIFPNTAYKMKIWLHLLKKCLMENIIFCAVKRNGFK